MQTSIPYHKLVDESLPSFNVENLGFVEQPDLFSPSRLTTNRTKAIIFINLFCLFQFLFMISSKYVMSTYNVSGLDYILFRTLACIVVHSISVRYYKNSMLLPRNDRKWIIIRALSGTG